MFGVKGLKRLGMAMLGNSDKWNWRNLKKKRKRSAGEYWEYIDRLKQIRPGESIKTAYDLRCAAPAHTCIVTLSSFYAYTAVNIACIARLIMAYQS